MSGSDNSQPLVDSRELHNASSVLLHSSRGRETSDDTELFSPSLFVYRGSAGGALGTGPAFSVDPPSYSNSDEELDSQGDDDDDDDDDDDVAAVTAAAADADDWSGSDRYPFEDDDDADYLEDQSAVRALEPAYRAAAYGQEEDEEYEYVWSPHLLFCYFACFDVEPYS
jgi:hypothetical protein